MVKLGISEFTFAYAFLHEQTNSLSYNLKSAPILPNLRQEAISGWDARLDITQGTFIYYQFKLSEILTRNNATYIRNGTYSSSYYRVSIHKNEANRQHNLLVDLANTHNNEVYYAVPEVSNDNEFHSAFLNNEIFNNSRIIPLSECNHINDEDQHYLTFQKGNQAFIQHSKHHYSNKSYSGRNIGVHFNTLTFTTLDIGFARGIFERHLNFVGNNMNSNQISTNNWSRADYLFATAKLLATAFGVTMVLVGR